jgi:uncharacterized membrane protein
MIMTSAPPPLTAEIADLKRQTHTLLYISGVNLVFNMLTILIAAMLAT